MYGYIFVQPQGDPFELTTQHPDWTTGESTYTDDGEWEIDLPWNVSIFGTNRSKLCEAPIVISHLMLDMVIMIWTSQQKEIESCI